MQKTLDDKVTEWCNELESTYRALYQGDGAIPKWKKIQASETNVRHCVDLAHKATAILLRDAYKNEWDKDIENWALDKTEYNKYNVDTWLKGLKDSLDDYNEQTIKNFLSFIFNNQALIAVFKNQFSLNGLNKEKKTYVEEMEKIYQKKFLES